MIRKTNMAAPLFRWLGKPRRKHAAPGQLTKCLITVTVHHEVRAYNGVTSILSVDVVNNLVKWSPTSSTIYWMMFGDLFSEPRFSYLILLSATFFCAHAVFLMMFQFLRLIFVNLFCSQ
jgi:hypothetical protein